MPEATNEKVIRLETQMQNVVSEIAEVKSLVKEVIVKVDNMTTLQIELVNLKSEMSGLQVQMAEIKSRAFRNGWLFPTLSAAAAAILTFLVLNLITRR